MQPLRDSRKTGKIRIVRAGHVDMTSSVYNLLRLPVSSGDTAPRTRQYQFTNFPVDQTPCPLFAHALPLSRVPCPVLFVLPLCHDGAEILNAGCNPRKYSLLYGPDPRELVCGDTDKHVESSRALLIIACRVAILCVEMLSLLPPTHAPLLRVFCAPPGGGSSPLRSALPFEPNKRHSLFLRPRRGPCIPSILVAFATQ